MQFDGDCANVASTTNPSELVVGDASVVVVVYAVMMLSNELLDGLRLSFL